MDLPHGTVTAAQTKGVFPGLSQVENSPSPADSLENPLNPWEWQVLGIKSHFPPKTSISSYHISISVAVSLPLFNLI